MTEDNKPIKKIEFAPGCFDNFEGTQEELDELMAEITKMFTEMTPEELKAKSRPLDIDELIDEEPEAAEAILRAIQNEEFRNTRH